jgi:peptidoglycan-N-acetylglucosamine deacetylase
MEKPIFYDSTGTRDRWSKRLIGAILVLVITIAVGFAWTVSVVPAAGPSFGTEHPARRPLSEQLTRLRHQAGWLPQRRVAQPGARPLSIAFYVPGDKESRASLDRNVAALDWVIPSVATVTNAAKTRQYQPDAGFRRFIEKSPHRPAVLPTIQNAAGDDQWDGEGLGRALANLATRASLTDWASRIVASENGSGIVFDFEQLPAASLGSYQTSLRETRAVFAKRGWQVALAVPLDDPAWDMRRFASVADRLILMNYDQHASADDPGPIAAQAWFVANLKRVMAEIPVQKAIVAIGGYAYDFTAKAETDMALSEAWLAAHDSEAKIAFDPASGNSTFRYEDDDGVHTIWMLDAATNWNELQAVKASGAAGFALWRLGSEDPGYWSDVKSLSDGTAPNLSTIAAHGNVDVEGTGELLRIADTPREGQRHVGFDQLGMIRYVAYAALPTPYVVEQSGFSTKQVALTFDDGPAPEWTPRILDVLEAKQAVGTFFIIGENAVTQPGLLNRILAGGSEIGNHSYTHPNLAEVSPRGTEIELNATQRLIEACTGHSTRLFRAPYFGDAEPTTSDELGPALILQQRGYLNVGLHADPNDWQRPGVQAIVDQTLQQIDNGTPDGPARIILLHDGSGDRAQTVAALPAIIDGLRARVSTGAGLDTGRRGARHRDAASKQGPIASGAHRCWRFPGLSGVSLATPLIRWLRIRI